MLVQKSILRVHFDIEKLEKIESVYYWKICWEVFWAAVDPEEIPECVLYHGHTDSRFGFLDLYCIAVLCPDRETVYRIEANLSQNSLFKKIRYSTPFAGALLEDIGGSVGEIGRVNYIGEFSECEDPAEKSLGIQNVAKEFLDRVKNGCPPLYQE